MKARVLHLLLVLSSLANLGLNGNSVPNGSGFTQVVEFGGRKETKPLVLSRPESALPQACRILVSTKEKTILCSGSYIGNGLVVTAGHCFWDVEARAVKDSRVQCGYAGMTPEGELVFAEEFKGLRVFSKSEEDGYDSDLAVIRLERKPERISPLKLAKSFDDLRSELLVPNPNMREDLVIAPDAECRFTGFGKDRKTGKNRFHESDQSPSGGLKAYVNNSLLFVDAWGDRPSWLNYGDSGGPLVCRRNTSHEWMLVAVLSAGEEKRKKTAWISGTSDVLRSLVKQALVTVR